MNISYHVFVEGFDIIVDISKNSIHDSSVKYTHEFNDDISLSEYIDIIKGICTNSNKIENFPKENIGLLINYNNKTNLKMKFYPFSKIKSKKVKIEKLQVKIDGNEINVPFKYLKDFKTNILDRNFEFDSLGEFRKSVSKTSKKLIEESIKILL